MSSKSRMIQNVLLIWLDNNIDENNTDSHNTIKQLQRVVNNVNTFTDGHQCIHFIESITDKKACIIISGSLGQHIVPQVHDMSQVDSIFIFCGNKSRHEKWASEWPKIKGVFTEISAICEALQQIVEQYQQNDISISFVDTSGDNFSNKNLDQLDPSFMYTQILKEILLSIEFEQKDIKKFIDYCRVVFADNERELKNIDKLEKGYHNNTPTWWYTCDCFLYSMVNRALRAMDVDIIIKMGFFIRDLHNQIEQLHSEQFKGNHANKIFMVYRGQGMKKADFEQIQKTKGGLISFNNFLSTNKDPNVSLSFTQSMINNPDLVGVLFRMTIDPSRSTVPFASIGDVSYHPGEEEVLFSMHTVFRINDIKPIDEKNRLFQINLTLTSDTDKDLQMLTDRIREEISHSSNAWHRLSSLLLKIGQFDKAQQVNEILLEKTTNQTEKVSIYHQLGLAKYNQGEYNEALLFYEKALEINQKIFPPNHPNLASSYKQIGSVYFEMEKYSKALSFYEKALEINQKALPSNHPDLATSYNQIGSVYFKMEEYSKALSFYENALEINQKILPSNHPDLATSYNQIGSVYFKMEEYSKALSFYERAVDIAERTLPLNHPNRQKWQKDCENTKKKL